MRLFVALELPLPVKAALLGVMGGVAGARWQTEAQLHLTLRFIGDVDRHQAADIAAALGRVNTAPLTLTLDGIGSFEHRGRVDTLWAGVRPRDEVAALARRIDAALVQVGLPAERRAYVAHITLARLGRTTGPLVGFPASTVPALPFTVEGFALWESRLTRDGADYTVLERYQAASRSR